jgi:hypothetical protein
MTAGCIPPHDSQDQAQDRAGIGDVLARWVRRGLPGVRLEEPGIVWTTSPRADREAGS